MKFVQIIEFRTEKIDEVRKLDQEYQQRTEGKRSSGHSYVCADRDQEGRYFVIIEFPSKEAAEANDALPETQEISGKMSALADGPPTFYNLDVIDESD